MARMPARSNLVAVETSTIRVDSQLASALIEELDGIIRDAKESLTSGFPFEKYQQACGMIEAYSQVRNTLIPRILQEMQRS